MEELGEGLVRVILRVLRTILIEGICESLCYWLGRWFLLILTLGRYPQYKQLEKHQGRITLVGIIVLITLVLVISVYV
ncbi:MAG: hypothetical protein NWQ54_11230 [Paraglaciecola sp.]|uniref:hypothetical protein n=1 Tax=Paraglaciecola sp. TaxID=1920173 RepID=UPI00273FAD67|nr:hypothetical protein [Paraglaciecola sp.]MDP5030400.1 hypothetical protein [Paraglaciecola sp.]MDP5131447.1 hypothetical protein [Paraglaciecola sp.]